MVKRTSTILIVEDERTLNDAYQFILRQAGYNVLSAMNGKEALKIVEEGDPALILLDLRMPYMDGVHFLQSYDPKHLHPTVKIIVFSNYDMQKEIEQAYKYGADRYILKAWASPKELLKIVQDALREPKAAK